MACEYKIGELWFNEKRALEILKRENVNVADITLSSSDKIKSEDFRLSYNNISNFKELEKVFKDYDIGEEEWIDKSSGEIPSYKNLISLFLENEELTSVPSALKEEMFNPFFARKFTDTINDESSPTDISDRLTDVKDRLSELMTRTPVEVETPYDDGYQPVKSAMNPYIYSKSRLAEMKISMISLMEEERKKETPDQDKLSTLSSNIDLIDKMLKNFGDENSLKATVSSGKGLISYHMKEGYMTNEEIDDSESEVVTALSGYDRNGNESSVLSMADRGVLFSVNNLYEVVDGEIQYDEFGLPKKADFRRVWNAILGNTLGLRKAADMYNALLSASKETPELLQFLERAGRYDDPDPIVQDRWTSIVTSLSKFRIPLYATVATENGSSYIKLNNPKKMMMYDWRIRFLREDISNNPFIVNTTAGRRIDTEAVFDHFNDYSTVKESPAKFLSALGMYVTDNEKINSELSKSKWMYFLYKRLERLASVGTKLRTPEEFFEEREIETEEEVFNLKKDNTNLNLIVDLNYRYGIVSSFGRVETVEGNTKFETSLNSSFTTTVSSINNSKTFKDLVDSNPTEFSPEMNPFITSLKIMRSIFKLDEKYEGTSEYGQKYKDQNGDDVVLEYVSSEGFKVIIEGNERGKKKTDLNLEENTLSEFISAINSGEYSLPKLSDKNSAYSLRFPKWTGGALNEYVSTRDVIDGKHESYVQKILVYLNAEIARMKKLSELSKEEDVIFDHDYLKKGQSLELLRGIFSVETLQAIDNIIGSGSTLNDVIDSELEDSRSSRLYSMLEKDIKSYFAEISEQVIKTLSPYVIPMNIKKKYFSLYDLTKEDKNLEKRIRESLSLSFVINEFMNSFETIILLNGDPVQIPSFFKRNSTGASSGLVLRNDSQFFDHVNNNIGRPFTKQNGYSVDEYNGYVKTAVIKDVKGNDESLYNELLELAKETMSKEEAERTFFGYKDYDVTDSFCMVSFDFYRIALKASNQWSDSQEELFQKILKGETIDEKDISQGFPILKMQYSGPLLNDYMRLTTIHKYTWVPIIPGTFKSDSKMSKINDKMMKEGIDYVVFKSGVKTAKLTKNGELYDTQSNGENLDEEPFLKNVIDADFLKMQIKSDPVGHDDATFFSQCRKLISNGIFEKGLKVEGREEDYENFNDLKSRIFDITKVLKEELLEKLGFDVDENRIINFDRLKDYLVESLEGSNVSVSEILDIEEKDLSKNHNFSISANSERLEKIIVNMASKRITRMKIPGSLLVQTPDVFRERENGKDSTLKSYALVNGKVRPAECKIALQGEFFKLLDMTYKGEPVGTRERLNEMINDEEWLSNEDNLKLITIFGVRLPTDEFHSMDVFVIRHFYPSYMTSAITTPANTVVKDGSDFDHDKRSMSFPIISSKKSIDKIDVSNINGYNEAMMDKGYLMKSLKFYETVLKKSKLDIKMSEEEKDAYNIMLKNAPYKVSLDLDGQNGDLNKMRESFMKLMLSKNNYLKLMTPVSTELAEVVADVVSEKSGKSSSKDNDNSSSLTKIFEFTEQARIQETFRSSSVSIGMGATALTFNVIDNEVNLTNKREDQTFMLRHNVNDKSLTSLSSSHSAVLGTQISTVLSSLENAWLDAANNPFFYRLNADMRRTEMLLYALTSGAELEDVSLYMGNKLFERYLVLSDRANSITSPLLVKKRSLSDFESRAGYVLTILKRNKVDNSLLESVSVLENSAFDSHQSYIDFLSKTIELLSDEYHFDQEYFSNDDLVENLRTDKDPDAVDYKSIIAFIDLLRLEALADAYSAFRKRYNYDVRKFNSFSELFAMEKDFVTINDLFSEESLSKMDSDTVISPFDVKPILSVIGKELFPIESNEFFFDDLSKYFTTRSQARLSEYVRDKKRILFKNLLLRALKPGKLNKNKYEYEYLDGKEIVMKAKGNPVKVGSKYITVNGVALRDSFESKDYMSSRLVNGVSEPSIFGKEDPFDSVERYIVFMITYEYLKNKISIQELKKSKVFSFFRDNVFETLKQSYNESFEDFSKRVDERTRDLVLMDKAFISIKDPNSMMRGTSSMANRLSNIFSLFPSVSSSYDIVNYLSPIASSDSSEKIIKLTRNLDAGELKSFESQFKDLSHGVVSGISNSFDLEYVKDFFSNLDILSVLQSGGAGYGLYSFSDIVDMSRVSELVDSVYSDVMKYATDDGSTLVNRASSSTYLMNIVDNSENGLASNRVYGSSVDVVPVDYGDAFDIKSRYTEDVTNYSDYDPIDSGDSHILNLFNTFANLAFDARNNNKSIAITSFTLGTLMSKEAFLDSNDYYKLKSRILDILYKDFGFSVIPNSGDISSSPYLSSVSDKDVDLYMKNCLSNIFKI